MNQHLLLPLAVAALMMGCTTESPLHKQLDDDWKYWMTQYPEAATAFGYPGQNTRWTDYSQASIDARADYLKKSLDRLKGINRNELSAADQINYDLYLDLLETAVKGLEFHNDAMPIKGVTARNLLMPVNQLESVQQNIPHVIAIMPAETLQDYKNIVSRLERVGPLVDQTIALMQQGIAAKMTPPQITLRDVPAQVQSQIFDDPMKSPMLEAFKRMPASISAADQARLKDRASMAYTSAVVPSFRKLRQFLLSSYLPACRETTDAASLPNGSALY